MTGFGIIYLFITGFIAYLHAGTVERIYVRDNKPVVKGSNIQLVCEISQFSSSDTLEVYKISDTNLLTQCDPSSCLTTTIGRYTFSADNSNVYINITSVSRSEDQHWWTCALVNGGRKKLMFIVITVPESLQYVHNPPRKDQDLAQNAVQLTCRTGCAYPWPKFTWFYTVPGKDSLLAWPSSGPVFDVTFCPDSEIKFTSTLSLPRYTIFPGNIEKTVQFKCSVSYTGISQLVYSGFSPKIQFSVQVSNATLREGTSTVIGQLQVISGISKTLTCDTGVSRPVATIVWYIGTQEKQRSDSSTFTFNPQTTDNNKTVHCKAFNIQPESEAVSSYKSKLFVEEQTTAISFFLGQNENQTVATFEEHDVNIPLTCIVTGMSAIELYIIFNGDIIASQSNSNELKYTVPVITCTTGGIYICNAVDNFDALTNKTVTLFVECSPRPVRQVLRNLTSQVSKPITLSFMVIAYPEPGPKGFTWFMEDRLDWVSLLSNEDLQISSSALETNLTISNVSREHFGKYRVTSVNRIGSFDQILFLSEKDFKPDICNTCNKETCSFTMSIVLGILCVVLVGYGTGISILYKRNTKKNGTTTHSIYGANTGNDNIGNTTEVTEEQDFENNATEADEDTSRQYTELKLYSNDTDTYEPLRV